MFLIFGIVFYPREKECSVKEVISPVEIVLDNGENFYIKDVETFDGYYSEKNRILAKKFGITEEEAFISGNFAKYWAKNLLEGREVKPEKNDLIYYKYSYYSKLLNSPFCIKDGKFTNEYAFQKHLKSIRKGKFTVIKEDSHLKETLKLLGIIKRTDRFKGIMNKWRRNKIIDYSFLNNKILQCLYSN